MKNKIKKAINKKIDLEVLNLLYSESITNIIVISILILIIHYILRREISNLRLFIWTGINFFILLLRVLSVIFYKTKIIKKFENKTNGLILTLLIYASAICLSCAAFLIFPSDMKLRVFVVFIFGGIVIGAIGGYAIRLQIALAYVFLLSIPIITLFLIEHSKESLLMAGLSALFVLAMVLNTLKIHKVVKRSLLIKFENIDLIKKLSKQRRQALKLKKEAEEANKSKSIFLANISHEIRTPMNAVVGFSDLLLQTNLDSHQKNYLQKIKESSTLLLHIINQILDYSNIASREFTIVNKRVNIRAILEETKAMMDIIAREKSLTIKLQISDEIPEEIISDPLRIRQIIINLTNNAIKFTKQGQVIIKCFCKNKQLICSVKDSGIGIEKNKIDKLFKRFSRIDASSQKFQGTGLGLAISKLIVTSLGGEINVKSQLGKGSEFYFSLPINLPSSKQKKQQEQKNIKKENITTNSQKQQEINILIAEDNQVNRELIELLLKKKKWLTDSVMDGEEVLEAIQKKKYDLILMDIQMPNMDGTQATKIIREQERNSNNHIPIIAFTAMGHTKRMKEYLAIGMDDFVSKPVNTQKLYEKIEKILNKNLQKK